MCASGLTWSKLFAHLLMWGIVFIMAAVDNVDTQHPGPLQQKKVHRATAPYGCSADEGVNHGL